MSNLKPSRQIRGEQPVDVAQEQPTTVPVRGSASFSKFQPYTGPESLPMPTGKAKRSHALYELVRSGRRYKLLRFQRSVHGVHREVARILEPSNKKRPQDKILFAALKKAGIPGAN